MELWNGSTVLLMAGMLLVHLTRAFVDGCPGSCACKWKNGKQTVECNAKNLLSIPGGMDVGTQVLDMSDNKLDELHSEIFLKMELINLQRIFVARCRIHAIDERTFKGLTNLVELDLAGNLLETIPTAAFLDCTALMRLTLNANPIKSVARASFARLTFLSTLEISDCELATIDPDAFHGLSSLEWLRLDGNQLRTIRARQTLPEQLRGVELQGNPWDCDCHLVELRAWLKRYNGSMSMDPLCAAPPRHAKRAIKSVKVLDLACLPRILSSTATTTNHAVIEVDEGKNVSLLCNIQASPEAHVTWWLDGRLLQNETDASGNVRLLYFTEKGTEEQRSELLIYHTSAEYNGTFVCTAENPAGAVSTNFTIRIVGIADAIVVTEVFPYEYVLAVVVGIVVLFKCILIIIIVCVFRCRRKRAAQNREKAKEVTLHYEQTPSTKCALTRDHPTEPLRPVDAKQDMVVSGGHELLQDVLFYSPALSKEALRTMSPLTVANQVRSPISLRRYQLEQNPDLINDTESGGRSRKDEVDAGSTEAAMMHPTLVQFQPVSCMRLSRQLYAIHSWDTGCTLDADGYPADYGLPKMTLHPKSPICTESFYRTLPYNRAAKRHSAANPTARCSREAEFLTRSPAHPAPYEHYCPDVRYTADGYVPKHVPQVTIIPSPPEGYKGESIAPTAVPCTSNICWPNKSAAINRRCVGAQTDANNEQQSPRNYKKTESAVSNEAANGISQSPDEGYVDEQTVTL